MPAASLHSLTITTVNSSLKNAHLILKKSHEAANNFWKTYNSISTRRRTGARSGAPTDQEQDQLRAMLIFSSAGLDSMLKSLIENALEKVIDNDQGAQQQFEIFLERRLRKVDQKAILESQYSNDKSKTISDVGFLAKALANKDPRKFFIQELINELCANSLQSLDQLVRVAAFFAIQKNELVAQERSLKDAFKVRNEIIHEMDVKITTTNIRSRTPRNKPDMLRYTNAIIKTAEQLLVKVNSKI